MNKKILFLDRDGTLVIEPPQDYQLDSLEKLTFYPMVFQYLGRIVKELDFELVMVTNQDGLGTPSFPEEKFYQPHQKIIEAFENEGIIFKEVHIDRSFAHENKLTRKPNVGMLLEYVHGNYDLPNSFVIGDRLTDVELAQNLGCQAILIGSNKHQYACLNTNSWEEIYNYLKVQPRTAIIERKTNETDIVFKINLDGSGKADIQTGIGFFDHQLEQIAKHAHFDIDIKANGDLHVDEHHIIEDVAICFGQAVLQALGSKKGIERYGFLLPMDDCLAQVAIDFSGRPWFKWDAYFTREKIGNMPTEMFSHFFKSFSDQALCNLHITANGNNEHHKIEAIFKACAKALKMAVAKNNNNYHIPSTKGSL